MAVPKRKQSKARGRKRRTNWKYISPQVSKCSQCTQPKLPYRAPKNFAHIHKHLEPHLL